MKKFILMAVMSIFCFSETLDLAYFLKNKKSDSIIQLDKEKLDLKENELKKKNYNDVYLSLNGQKKNGMLNLDLLNFEITYGDFSYNISRELEEDKKFMHTIDFTKNLNSIFYGEEDYRIKNYDLEKKITEFNMQKSENTKTVSLIEAYGNLLKIQKKIEIQEMFMEENRVQKNFMLKTEKQGDSINLEAVKFEEKTLQLKQENLLKEHKFYADKLFSISGVYFSENDKLKEIDEELVPIFENIGKIDLEILETKNLMLSEKRKYDFLKNRIQYNFSTEYILDKNDYIVRLTASDKIMLTNFEKKESKLDEEILALKTRDQKIDNREKKEKNILDYNNEITELKLLREKIVLNRKNLVSKEKQYRSGNMNYLDYLDELHKVHESEIELLEKEIDLKVLAKSSNYLE